MAGAITDADRTFIEEWENISVPTWDILKFDFRGDVKHELIQGRRNFTLSTAERKVTEERILKKEDNPFRNGAFRPVIVPDSVSIDTNPNALSDDEITSILVSSEVAWDEWMKVIDSPETLNRMLEIASAVDGMTLSRFRQITGKLADARPRTQIKSKDREQFERMGGSAL